MKNIDDILTQIKIELRSKIIGSSFLYKGQLKKVKKFSMFWSRPEGFHIIEEFDLAEIPVSGPTSISVKFVCWSIIDIDGNISSQVTIEGIFGPIEVSFENYAYSIDTSHASFSRIEVA